MLDLLCAVIRETGASDSAAASRAGVHPSTVSRWKRDCPDVAILLRAAREDFRQAQLSVIFAEAAAGHARSWRAAAWLLERTFPEDYAPRAKERAAFQERFDALCAAEEEGGAVALSTSSGPSALPNRVEPLQNVKNSPPPAVSSEAPARAASPALAPELTLPLTPLPRGGAMEFRLPETPLQNVKNPALAGPLSPPMLSTKTVPI
jgi:hypothetical protein